jgi:hypothetical protein
MGRPRKYDTSPKSTEAVRAHRARLRAELGEEGYKRRQNEAARAYRKANPHVMLATNHRISAQQAKSLYALMQTATCEICGGGKGRVLYDHDHKTEEFRGFLCVTCNNGIGMFRDDPELLREAIIYLERSR